MKYRRVVISHLGEPEVMTVIEDDTIEPGVGEVRIRVLAAGIARADLMMRTGHYPFALPDLPFTPGYDCVGVVDMVGEGVNALNVGQQVAALIKIGGYSEYINLPQERLVPVPIEVDAADAACLVLNGLTAYQMLHRFAQVKSGERALFHGAASGVSSIMLQLGALVGLTMYGNDSQAKQEIIKNWGATPIDYQNEDFVQRISELTNDGVDAVFDNIGGMHLWRSFNTLHPGGRLIAYGEISIAGVDKPAISDRLAHHLLPRVLKMGMGGRTAVWYENYHFNEAHPEWYYKDLETLFGLLQDGKIHAVIAEKFPLVEAAKAHALLESGTKSGKIVLISNDGKP